MNSLSVFRHEFKYNIDYCHMVEIRERLKQVLQVDCDINGYMVRSLYFDSIDDSDYYQKLSGDISRKKIRLRVYDPTSDFVKLELKAKNDIHQLKESLILDRKTSEEIIKGNYDVLLNYDDDIARKIYVIMREKNYIPKSIIEYKRIAFISPNNTRITMDFDIKVSPFVDNVFFDKEINYLEITNPNQAVLEVKFDHFIEDYLQDILENTVANTTSISKYVIGRNKEV